MNAPLALFHLVSDSCGSTFPTAIPTVYLTEDFDPRSAPALCPGCGGKLVEARVARGEGQPNEYENIVRRMALNMARKLRPSAVCGLIKADSDWLRMLLRRYLAQTSAPMTLMIGRKLRVRLRPNDIVVIRAALANGDSISVIARFYGADYSTIQKISHGLHWRKPEKEAA